MPAVSPSVISAHALEALTLVTLGLILGLVVNQFHDVPLSVVYETKAERMEKAAARLTASLKPPGKTATIAHPTQTIDAEQLQRFLQAREGILFDARIASAYRAGHIPSALSLPQDDFENAYRIYRAELEKNLAQPIVVYCSSVTCENAALLQKAFHQIGFSNVSVYPGGWADWQAGKLPVEIIP